MMHWAIFAPELSETCNAYALNYASVMRDEQTGNMQQRPHSAEAQTPRHLQVGTWQGELSPLVVCQIQSFDGFNLHVWMMLARAWLSWKSQATQKEY